jgi:LmbE family N-acetylglucosaminyl deacetylase
MSNSLPEKLLLGAVRLLNPEPVERLAAGRIRPRGADLPLDRLLESAPRVLWVGAHPDDESFGGAIFAKAGLRCGCPLHFLVLTRGEGGECLVPCGRQEPLGDLRTREMTRVAELYNATLEMHDYPNAGLPVASFPRRHEIARVWADHGDPVERIARTIRSFRPDVVLTFAPDYGSTGHPEHQVTARFTTRALEAAAADGAGLPGQPHRPSCVYYLLNRYWFTRLTGAGNDPWPCTELFDVRQPCVAGMTCGEVMAENTCPHHSQAADMGLMRQVALLIHYAYLYRVNLPTDGKDPFEFWPVKGMG